MPPIDASSLLSDLSDEDWDRVNLAKSVNGFGSPGPLAALDRQSVAARSLDESDLSAGLGGPNVVSSLGPGIPIGPAHPEEGAPRRWDYAPGYNVQTRPRAYEPITFDTLIALGRNYDVASLAREKRLDDFRKMDWLIRPKRVEGERRKARLDRASRLADPINNLTGFWSSPDQEKQWGTWVYAYLDQMFVIDAPTLYLRYTKGGDLYSVEVIDGSTILPLIDLWGRLPAPPMAAYRQIIHGMPWTFHERLVAADNETNFSKDQMTYDPFWTYANSPYGHPPTERIILAINRALRRQTLDISMFTEGSTPPALYSVPDKWSGTQIAELQAAFDVLGGNDVAKSKLRFVPGGVGAGLIQMHAEPKNEVEEWLMMIACGAHGVSPMELGFTIKSSGLGGKGFADQQAKSSNERNIALALHVQQIITKIVNGPQKQPDLEFVFPGIEETEDSLTQAQQTHLYWQMGVMSSDYIAEDVLDIDPPGLGPTVLSGNAVVPITAINSPDVNDPNADPNVPPDASPDASVPDTGVDAGKPVVSPGAPSATPGQDQAPVQKARLDRLVMRVLQRQYPDNLLDWVKSAQWRYDPHVLLREIDMARRPGGRDMGNVDRIEQDVEQTGQISPVVLVQTPGGGKLKIADGWHRTLAAQHAGGSFIPAYIGAVTETSGPWDRAMQEVQYRKAVTVELRKWETKALRALKAGKSPDVRFESDLDLPSVELAKVANAGDVRAAFAKAGASAVPFDLRGDAGSSGSLNSSGSGHTVRQSFYRRYFDGTDDPQPLTTHGDTQTRDG